MSSSPETSTLPPPLRIAVIGGGIAGLSSALALHKAKEKGINVDIQVYESAVSLLISLAYRSCRVLCLLVLVID